MRKRSLVVGVALAGALCMTACGSKTTPEQTDKAVSAEAEVKSDNTLDEVEDASDEEAETVEEAEETKSSKEPQTVILDGFEDMNIEEASESDIEKFNSDNPYFSINTDAIPDNVKIQIAETVIPGTDDIAYAVGFNEENDSDSNTTEDGGISLDGTGGVSGLAAYRNSSNVTKEGFDALKTKVGEGDKLEVDDIKTWGYLIQAAGGTGASSIEEDGLSVSTGELGEGMDEESIAENLDTFAGMLSNRKVADKTFVQLNINFLVMMKMGVNLGDVDDVYMVSDITFGNSGIDLSDIIEFKDVKEHHKSDTVAPVKEKETDGNKDDEYDLGDYGTWETDDTEEDTESTLVIGTDN